MGEAFRLGGWGMYPTTIIGLILLATAVLYARQPTARRLRVVSNLRLLTMLSGCLGFIAGTIRTFTTVPDASAEPLQHALVGVGESLHNIGAAVFTLVIATILTTLGAARTTADDAELVEPRIG